MLPFRAGRALRTDSATNKVILGIPRDPLDVLTEACKLVHPVERSDVINLAVAVAIQKPCELSPLELLKCRKSFFSRTLSIICWLNEQEASLHANTPPHLGKVMKGKRILLLDALLRESGHPDKLLCAHLEKGFPLFGRLQTSSIFAEQWCPPALHPDELLRVAPKQNQWILGSCKRSRHAYIDAAVWDATLMDVEKGWAIGPFSLEEAQSMTDKPVVISRRFGAQQKNRVRAIDDLSASQINACTGVKEKVRVESVDAAATMIQEWMRAFHGSGRTLVGKTYDLKSACRQLGICSEHLHAAWICVSSPYMTEPALFQLHAMPFGATAAVTNFLRCAEALKACSATLLHFAWTSFFNDFIIIAPEDCAEEQTGPRGFSFSF